MNNQLFKTLIDATGNAFAATKRVVGDVMDNTVNSIAAFVAKDTDGNAAYLKLNAEGSLCVTNDAGAAVNGAPIVHLAGAQTKDQEDEAGTVALETEKTYGKVECQVIGTRDMLWKLVWVSDNGVTDVETVIGYGFTGAGEGESKICASIKEFTTTAVGAQVLKLYATPLDKESDAYANLSAYKFD